MSTEQGNSISSSRIGIKNIHRTDHAISTLEQMRTLDYFYDVALIAGKDGKKVSAHRLVLSAASPYFYAMFSGSMREAKEYEVTLNEVRGDILEALVEFCYSGRMQLRQDTVELVLRTASLFQMNSVVTECTNYLIEQLDPSNCLGFLFFAEKHNMEDLQKKAEDYIHQEFTQVCKNDEFLNLKATQLAAIIASDDVYVSTEEVIFHSVMKWVNSNLSERGQHIRELLQLVRMTQLSPSFIFDHVDAVCCSNDCQDLLIDALKWHTVPQKRQEMATEYTKPRNSTFETLLVIGFSGTDETINIECYDPLSDKWTVWSKAINYRDNFGVATMDDNLLIVGGSNNNRALNAVISLNLTTLAVTDIEPMSTPRHELCVAVLENSLYAIGGVDGSNNYFNSVERWDPVECTWTFVAPMPTARSNASAAILNGCIYVLGGRSGGRPFPTVECYNQRSNTWTVRAPMSVGRRNFGVAVTKGILYAAGGISQDGVFISTAECYDPVTDKWTIIEPMSMARYAFGCAFLGQYLMAVGGANTNSIEEYDPDTNKWSNKRPLTNMYENVSVCNVPTRYMFSLSLKLMSSS